jgi:hypothetical protein
MAMEVAAVTPTLYQKRVMRRLYAKPIEIKTKRVLSNWYYLPSSCPYEVMHNCYRRCYLLYAL